MPWKLRKDNLPADTPEETASLADTAIPDEPVVIPMEGPSALPPEPAASPQFEPDPHPFVPFETDDAAGAPAQEPVFLSPGPEAEQTAPEAAESAPETEPSSFFVAEPKFTDEPIALSPFAPFQPESSAAHEPFDPEPVFPPSLDREEVAPSLVHAEADSEIPHVAPFIVDVPPITTPDVETIRTLVVRIGNLAANFTLTKDATLIGRPDSILQSYPDVEIELDDAVSRRHAEIRRHDGQYFLTDLGSTNGTLLNGTRLEAQQEYPLAHGDRIHIGDRTEIIFE
jgi:hypothetical protein